MKLRKGSSNMKKVFLGVISLFAGIVMGIAGALHFAEIEYKKERQRANNAEYFSQKHLSMFFMLNKWIRINQEGKSLVSYFEKNGYKKIAIYGMGYIGNTLVQELKDTSIQVAYGIDQKANSLKADIEIITMADAMERVDLIVITTFVLDDSIKKELEKRVDYPLIALEDILGNI